MSILLVACVTEDLPRNEGVSVGDPLPMFEVTLNNGTTVTTGSLKGKVAVIVFFTTGCGDCRREVPRLEEVYRNFSDNPGVEMFAISREEKAAEVEVFWKEFSLTMPYSAQPDRAVYNAFATTGVPRVYIADSENIITAAFDDSDMPSPETLIKFVNAQEKL